MSTLSQMLEFIHENNDFYKRIIKENHITNVLDIKQYPILKKIDLQMNRYNMFSDGYLEKYYWEQLLRKSTSGSSGIPVNVYWDYNDFYASMKYVWKKRRQYYGILPSDKKVMFSFNSFEENDKDSKIKYVNDVKNVLDIDISAVFKTEKYNDLIDLINSFSPKWFYIRPFVLKKLISIYKKTNKSPPESLMFIESHGEILPEELRKQGESLFMVPIANMYGSEEVNTIAYECPHHNMHILQENVVVECYRNGKIYSEGNGEAIVTSLTNKSMPLIRYNLGDDIVLSNMNKPCRCGEKSQVITLIKGRTIDSIKLHENNELNALLFIEIMTEINNHFNDIISCYNFVYVKSREILNCYLLIEQKYAKWYINIKKAIEQLIREKITHSITLKISLLESENISYKKNRIFEITD